MAVSALKAPLHIEDILAWAYIRTSYKCIDKTHASIMGCGRRALLGCIDGNRVTDDRPSLPNHSTRLVGPRVALLSRTVQCGVGNNYFQPTRCRAFSRHSFHTRSTYSFNCNLAGAISGRDKSEIMVRCFGVARFLCGIGQPHCILKRNIWQP